MKNLSRCLLVAFISSYFPVTVATAQDAPEQSSPAPTEEPTQGPFNDPTFSLEVVRLNGIVIQNGPVSEIQASPGDTLLIELSLRNWSPDGEELRAYQAQIDNRSYTSGFEGTIRALGYDETTGKGLENKESCFVDVNDPRFIFLGIQNFAITDSVSPSHRWLGALVEVAQAPVAKQDGKKYYCGTLKMKVSENARGPFTLRLIEETWASTLRDPKNNPILHLSFEKLVVNVGPRKLRVLSSDPPAGAIDARVGGGWKRVLLRHNNAATPPAVSDFLIEDGTPNPPRIINVEFVGSLITLELNRGITQGGWTKITHIPSGTGTQIGHLPGDVDNSGVTDTQDMASILNRRGFADGLANYRIDINADGHAGIDDALALIELLNKPAAYRSRIPPRN